MPEFQCDWIHTPQAHQWAAQWRFPADTIYLNHGSFGPSPRSVRETLRHWSDRLHDQPMNFFVRELESAWLAARQRLAQLVGAPAEGIALVDNATYGMNIVAASHPLQPGDEVLLNQHEYGAVRRIWQRACQQRNARLVDAEVTVPIESSEQIVDQLFAHVTPRTRLIVVSHITSATAITLPVAAICRRAAELEIPVCIDGPHAVAQVPLQLEQLGCQYYTASCHKWLCAPLGSGFLYVAPESRETIQPPILSWGRLLPNVPETFDQEFWWSGTRDPSPLLSIPAAIDFMESAGWDRFRTQTHEAAQLVRHELERLGGQAAWIPDSPEFYGCMAEVPLPPGDWSQLQRWLWEAHGIEVPIIHFADAWLVRVSIHLYTRPAHLDRLFAALHQALRKSGVGH